MEPYNVKIITYPDLTKQFRVYHQDVFYRGYFPKDRIKNPFDDQWTNGPMSILWTKKVESSRCFFKSLIFFLLGCHIVNCTVKPFSVIPGFYILENCPAGFLKVLIDMKIDFLLL